VTDDFLSEVGAAARLEVPAALRARGAQDLSTAAARAQALGVRACLSRARCSPPDRFVSPPEQSLRNFS
jgi:hypothetical protein